MPEFTVNMNIQFCIQARDAAQAAERAERLDVAAYKDGTKPTHPAWLKDTLEVEIEVTEEEE